MTILIKKKIITAIRKQNKIGFNLGSEGNISVRNDENFFITPSGCNVSDLSEKDICILDSNGRVINKKNPSSEIKFHLIIYNSNKNIKAIVHSHSPWASIISCLRKEIPSFHYMVAEFGGKNIKCADYAKFGTNNLAKNVLTAINNRKGCLISNHGQITVGENLDEALNLSEALEKLSMQYYHCLLTKKVKLLKSSQMDEVIEAFKEYKSKH